jgi:adenylylsulfate kinase
MNNPSTNITWHTGNVTREDRQKMLGQRGVTVWMTGLSGAGKSTIGVLVEQMLLARRKHVYRLDGDNLRFGLNADPGTLLKKGLPESAAQRFGLGFSADDRAENIRRVGEVAKLFTDAGVIVIASFISPYRRDRDAIRAGMAAGDFVECHVAASLAAAEGRDPKGLYKKARAGQIKGFTGIDDPYEAPEHAEITLNTEAHAPDKSAEQVVAYLEQQGYLRA